VQCGRRIAAIIIYLYIGQLLPSRRSRRAASYHDAPGLGHARFRRHHAGITLWLGYRKSNYGQPPYHELGTRDDNVITDDWPELMP
jgi:hypothetical protein